MTKNNTLQLDFLWYLNVINRKRSLYIFVPVSIKLLLHSKHLTLLTWEVDSRGSQSHSISASPLCESTEKLGTAIAMARTLMQTHNRLSHALVKERINWVFVGLTFELYIHFISASWHLTAKLNYLFLSCKKCPCTDPIHTIYRQTLQPFPLSTMQNWLVSLVLPSTLYMRKNLRLI